MKDVLISALTRAGKILLDAFNKPLDIRVKESDNSIVTDADIKSETLIIKLIKDNFPAHNIISEEWGFTNNTSDYTWVIDPLDGTSNFASGLPWFGVMITIFNHNVPVMAGAYLPIPDELYFAEKGNGAFKNGKLFKMPANAGLKKSLIAFSVDYTEDEILFNRGIEFYKNIVKGSRNIRCTNSLLDFIYVLEGKFGACVNLYTKIWDISGLGLILSEAGGIMLDIEGKEIDFLITEGIIKRNFPVMGGPKEIIESLKLSK